MLTRELLRYRLSGTEVQAQFLRSTPAIVTLAEALLHHWNSHVGKRIGDISDAALPILHTSRALVVGRGLQKLIIDECTISEPPVATAMRATAFDAAAALLAHPARDSEAHAQTVADTVQVPLSELRERLYGDLPDQALLAAAPRWSAKQLIERYNMALAQGLVMFAQSLDIEVHDADIGVRRRLLTALRFRRLLATVKQDAGSVLSLHISGPGSILEQANRYGLQLALFLPAVSCCKQWQARAELRLPRAGMATLTLSQQHHLTGDNKFLGYVPEELQRVKQALGTRFPDWAWEEPPLITHSSGEMIVPDVCVRHGTHLVTVEFFHRWHQHALERRLAHMAHGWGQHHVLGVDRTIAKRATTLLDNPLFKKHGFLFSDFPTPKGLGDAVARVCTP